MIRLIALLCISCGTIYAQFEGVIESRNATVDETGALQQYVLTMWIKGTMAKIATTATPSAPASTMIYRSDLRVMWMLNDDNKTYFEISQGKSQDESASQGGEPAKVKQTKKTRKVLGFACQQYLIGQGDTETEIWGTKGLPGLSAALARALGEERAGQGEAWNDEITKLGVFPLIANTRLEGRVVETTEVVKIDKRSLADDLFALPAGYKKQSVGDILK